MKRRLVVVLLAANMAYLVGCAGRQLLKVDIREDVKEELIVQKDPLADVSVVPASSQKQEKDGVTVEITYLRVMNASDYQCVQRSCDPLNPHLLFAFRMINTGDEIRYYNPIFAFKGVKTLDLANTDPCKFFTTYGAVNYILAKPGNKIVLSCQSKDADKSGLIAREISEPVVLYPDIPVYGILVVSQEQIDRAATDKKGVTRSSVEGWAAFFENVSSGRRPNSFRFDYTFTRKDWKEDVQYEKKTPYTYKVNVYQKTTTIPLLGTFGSGREEERVAGSERYMDPRLRRIGPVANE